MSTQQVFDQILAKMRTQGKPAIDPTSKKCEYKTDEGLHCAIGCLLNDEIVGEWGKLKGMGIKQLPDSIVDYLSDLAGGLDDAEYFFSRCQQAHDDACWYDCEAVTSSDWLYGFEKNMQNVASSYNLTYSPPAPTPT